MLELILRLSSIVGALSIVTGMISIFSSFYNENEVQKSLGLRSLLVGIVLIIYSNIVNSIFGVVTSDKNNRGLFELSGDLFINIKNWISSNTMVAGASIGIIIAIIIVVSIVYYFTHKEDYKNIMNKSFNSLYEETELKYTELQDNLQESINYLNDINYGEKTKSNDEKVSINDLMTKISNITRQIENDSIKEKIGVLQKNIEKLMFITENGKKKCDSSRLANYYLPELLNLLMKYDRFEELEMQYEIDESKFLAGIDAVIIETEDVIRRIVSTDIMQFNADATVMESTANQGIKIEMPGI